MALTGLLLAVLITAVLENGLVYASIASSQKPSRDSKKRIDVVDEAFLDQKDVLLDMLETKLKEVRDKKKKKVDRSDAPNLESAKCESLLSNVDLKLKANGLSAVGEAEIALKLGDSGKGTLNLDATGISNVGKARLELGVGNGGIYIPGLNNLLVGNIDNCKTQKEIGTATKGTPTHNFGSDSSDTRRSGGANTATELTTSDPNDIVVSTTPRVKANLTTVNDTVSSIKTDTTALGVNTDQANRTTVSPVTLVAEAQGTTVATNSAVKT